MKGARFTAGGRDSIGHLCLLTLACWLLSGCAPLLPSSTPPVYKVGLIAPFEGLYRNTGYAALDGLRMAIEECSPHDTALIPLALDDSYRPQAFTRAADKIGQDPQVVTWIGPLAPHLLGNAVQTQTASGLMPYLIAADNRVATHPVAAQALGTYLVNVANALADLRPNHTDGSYAISRVLIVGSEPVYADELEGTAIPLAWLGLVDLAQAPDITQASPQHGDAALSPASIVAAITQAYAPGDALLWLEPGPIGPATLAALRADLPDLPIVVGPDPGLALHLAADASADDPTFWAVWIDDGFADWATRNHRSDAVEPMDHQAERGDPSLNPLPAGLSAHVYAVYLVYVAVCTDLQHESASTTAQGGSWRMHLLPLAGSPAQ